MTRAEALAALTEVSQFSDDELMVLAFVAEGITKGRRTYGELVLARDRRDYAVEARCEIRDALVYLSAQLLRLERLHPATPPSNHPPRLVVGATLGANVRKGGR